ncbi:MAG: BatA and WFA domain-containing protein [Phycisphaerales bacterium]
MTLLAPLAGLFGAMLTLPVLVSFYLLRLRRRPLTLSSTMLWEQAAHDVQVNVPFRWIRPSLLLLLHLLILALFLLALARPAVITAGGGARRAFFLIDVSASMQATDAAGGLSRLDFARKRAIDVARTLGITRGDCSITVIAFAHEPSIVAPPTDTLSGLAGALAGIEPTDQLGRLEPALKLAETLITRAATEAESPGSAMVVVFSDGAFVDREPLSLAGAAVSYEPVSIARTDEAGNIAVVACSAARDENNPARARVFVRLQSTFRTERPVSLALLVDGELIRRHALLAPPMDSSGPGSIGRTFDIDVPDDALITCATAEGDLLACDDVASVYLPAPVRPRILLVYPDDSGPDPFLADALRELPSASYREAPLANYEAIADQLSGRMDLIVFDRTTPSRLPSVPTLTFGARLPGEPSSEPPATDGGFILTWDRRNPIMRDVSLDPVKVDRWLGPAPQDWLGTLGLVRDLALVRDGAIISLLQTRRADHALVRFELAQSNWPLNFSFPVFLFNAVDELTGAASSRSARSFSTTEPVVVRPLDERDGLILQGPMEIRIPQPGGEAGPVSLGIIPRAGVWRSARVDPPVIAVNLLNADESRLEAKSELVVAGARVRPADELAGPRELWPIFVAGAGVLLLIEWFVYAAHVRV